MLFQTPIPDAYFLSPDISDYFLTEARRGIETLMIKTYLHFEGAIILGGVAKTSR